MVFLKNVYQHFVFMTFTDRRVFLLWIAILLRNPWWFESCEYCGQIRFWDFVTLVVPWSVHWERELLNDFLSVSMPTAMSSTRTKSRDIFVIKSCRILIKNFVNYQVIGYVCLVELGVKLANAILPNYQFKTNGKAVQNFLHCD